MKGKMAADGQGVRICLQPENDHESALMQIFAAQVVAPGNRIGGGELVVLPGGSFCGLEFVVARKDEPKPAVAYPLINANANADPARIGGLVAEQVKLALERLAVSPSAT